MELNTMGTLVAVRVVLLIVALYVNFYCLRLCLEIRDLLKTWSELDLKLI